MQFLRFITGTNRPVPLLGWRVDMGAVVRPRPRRTWWYRLPLVYNHRQCFNRRHWFHKAYLLSDPLL